jgi:hypothetical protein
MAPTTPRSPPRSLPCCVCVCMCVCVTYKLWGEGCGDRGRGGRAGALRDGVAGVWGERTCVLGLVVAQSKAGDY